MNVEYVSAAFTLIKSERGNNVTFRLVLRTFNVPAVAMITLFIRRKGTVFTPVCHSVYRGRGCHDVTSCYGTPAPPTKEGT